MLTMLRYLTALELGMNILKFVRGIWNLLRRKKQPITIRKEKRMSNKKEFIEVVDFLIATGNAIVTAHNDDGKITLSDASVFLPCITLIPAAVSGFTLIPAEMKEFSAEDIAEIEAYIVTKIPGIGAKWVLLANAAFKVSSAVLDIIHALKSEPASAL